MSSAAASAVVSKVVVTKGDTTPSPKAPAAVGYATVNRFPGPGRARLTPVTFSMSEFGGRMPTKLKLNGIVGTFDMRMRMGVGNGRGGRQAGQAYAEAMVPKTAFNHDGEYHGKACVGGQWRPVVIHATVSH